jgi:hypothetical protein
MDEQLPLDFPERKAATVERALVVLRWIDLGDGQGKVEAHWPFFQMTTWFRNWREALPLVLHELNGHVDVRVRVALPHPGTAAIVPSLSKAPYQRRR